METDSFLRSVALTKILEITITERALFGDKISEARLRWFGSMPWRDNGHVGQSVENITTSGGKEVDDREYSWM